MGTNEINVLALVKGTEKYIFIFDDSKENNIGTIRQLGRFAANPDLSFTWYDAAVMAQRVRQGPTSHEDNAPQNPYGHRPNRTLKIDLSSRFSSGEDDLRTLF